MPESKKSLRSEIWFNDLTEPTGTAIYLERFGNYGITREELQSGRPVIGIAQTGSDIVPCNRHHITLAERVKAGIRDAGGIPMEFPVHPIQETIRRPTAALDRNLAYLGLVEVLAGYPFDGVVLTTGCDKTTPACLMAAATVNIPAIVLSGGPMLDGYLNGELAGSGTLLWENRRKLAAGEISEQQLVDEELESAPSWGHCNTMGTALSMNCLAEAMGMSLHGSAAVPAPYAERAKVAYRTGRRIVGMVHEGLTPSKIMTRDAFANAIVVTAALGGSTNCPTHINAIAAHMGVDLDIKDWDVIGHGISLLANVQPIGKHLGEGFYRAGGVPAIVGELLAAGLIQGDALTVSGKTISGSYGADRSQDHSVIRPYDQAIMTNAGFMVLSGNLFDSAIIKTSGISDSFRERFIQDDGDEGEFICDAVVFEGPEDYRRRIDDPDLGATESSMLVVRNVGPIGFPGSAEVVNMTPPGKLVKAGIRVLPCLGDGRQSGTSDSPSILNVSPEAAAGGNLAILETGDRISVNLSTRRVDMLVSDVEIAARWSKLNQVTPESHTPWEEMFRTHTTQLAQGYYLDWAVKYRNVGEVKPRHSY